MVFLFCILRPDGIPQIDREVIRSCFFHGKENGNILNRPSSNRTPPGGRRYRISLSPEILSIMIFTKACISSYRGVGRDPGPAERSVLERPDQISFSSPTL
jgi:hypothetical protein